MFKEIIISLESILLLFSIILFVPYIKKKRKKNLLNKLQNISFIISILISTVFIVEILLYFLNQFQGVLFDILSGLIALEGLIIFLMAYMLSLPLNQSMNMKIDRNNNKFVFYLSIMNIFFLLLVTIFSFINRFENDYYSIFRILKLTSYFFMVLILYVIFINYTVKLYMKNKNDLKKYKVLLITFVSLIIFGTLFLPFLIMTIYNSVLKYQNNFELTFEEIKFEDNFVLTIGVVLLDLFYKFRIYRSQMNLLNLVRKVRRGSFSISNV